MTDPTGTVADILDAELLGRAIGWRCFHCDEVFTDCECAREHFGIGEYDQPGCIAMLTEGGLATRWLNRLGMLQ